MHETAARRMNSIENKLGFEVELGEKKWERIFVQEALCSWLLSTLFWCNCMYSVWCVLILALQLYVYGHYECTYVNIMY